MKEILSSQSLRQWRTMQTWWYLGNGVRHTLLKLTTNLPYQTAPFLTALRDLWGHPSIARLFECYFCTVVQQMTRFQLTYSITWRTLCTLVEWWVNTAAITIKISLYSGRPCYEQHFNSRYKKIHNKQTHCALQVKCTQYWHSKTINLFVSLAEDQTQYTYATHKTYLSQTGSYKRLQPHQRVPLTIIPVQQCWRQHLSHSGIMGFLQWLCKLLPLSKFLIVQYFWNAPISNTGYWISDVTYILIYMS